MHLGVAVPPQNPVDCTIVGVSALTVRLTYPLIPVKPDTVIG